MFYPTLREIGWIEKDLESFAVQHRRHKASNKDAMVERIRAEARAFLQNHGFAKPVLFQVNDE